jgi:hypothetical protein
MAYKFMRMKRMRTRKMNSPGGEENSDRSRLP